MLTGGVRARNMKKKDGMNDSILRFLGVSSQSLNVATRFDCKIRTKKHNC